MFIFAEFGGTLGYFEKSSCVLTGMESAMAISQIAVSWAVQAKSTSTGCRRVHVDLMATSFLSGRVS